MPHTANKTLAQAERIMLVSVLLSSQYSGSNQTRERSFQAACMEAAELVRAGGRLVYATCSILPEENEAQAERFLQQHSDFELLDCSELLAAQKIPLNTGKYLRLDTATHNTDGFFAAVFQRKSA